LNEVSLALGLIALLLTILAVTTYTTFSLELPTNFLKN